MDLPSQRLFGKLCLRAFLEAAVCLNNEGLLRYGSPFVGCEQEVRV